MFRDDDPDVMDRDQLAELARTDHLKETHLHIAVTYDKLADDMEWLGSIRGDNRVAG